MTNPGSFALTQGAGLHIAGNGGGTITLATAGNAITAGGGGETILLNVDSAFRARAASAREEWILRTRKPSSPGGGTLNANGFKGSIP